MELLSFLKVKGRNSSAKFGLAARNRHEKENNLSKPLPYIGVTGLQSARDASLISNFLHRNKFHQRLGLPYLVMLGITSSNKRLRDPESSGKTSPKLNSLVGIFEEMPSSGCLPMLHYFTDQPQNLLVELKEIFTKPLPSGGEALFPTNCYSVQINQEWPQPELVKGLKTALGKKLQIVLQLPAPALQESPEKIAKRVGIYEIDYVLIDPSGGTGQDLDLDQASQLLLALDTLPHIQMGVAGGFSAENVEERIIKLHEKVRRPFCIDAQGKLRNESGDFQVGKAFDYLRNASKALSKVNGF
jgi:phosphoribosylanthranilate isomerase